MKMTLALAVVFIAMLIGAFLYTSVDKTPKQAASKTTDTASVSPSPLPTTDASEVAKLQQGGNSLADPKGVFVLLYPNDYKTDTQNNGQYMRIYKQGPSQKGQTEMYDGVILTFESVDLKSQTLEQWVDTQIKNAKGDGSAQITNPKTPTTINGFSGYTYSVRGLGEYKNIIVQKDANSKNAVSISIMVADPKEQGFQKEVDAVLSTIQLRK